MASDANEMAILNIQQFEERCTNAVTAKEKGDVCWR